MARIVFDLDGTLIDSAPDIHALANRILQGEGCAPISMAQTRVFIGNGAGVFVARMRAAAGLPETAQTRLQEAFVEGYRDAVTLTEPYAHVVEALDRLAGQGHALGICTNKPLTPCKAVLRHLGLEARFATVWGGDSLPARKPDPAPLHAAFDALGDGPRLYVGDSEVDAETAQRAGVPFLLFTQGYRKTAVAQIPHDVAFDSFADLPGQVAALLDAAT
ncbi:phosphoglycolate phosphatase [Pseudoponticoccus marisrubri]|uniref:Phosphoglycolate phosphatase n=1 Tax=Pseudoponticoccus marisrubri TaxID=1685382 RepID=A0A0W7WQG0_9RHOB|nr:phosphoglycolate phosphatase [Pseudoponticoccus marisrubri]KUF12812.1 phosphoglycolate phosphatase [Pseudoponticoccus marisrubri]